MTYATGALLLLQAASAPAVAPTASTGASQGVTVLQAVAPEYPATACEALVEGRVSVDVTVLPSGGLGETHAEGIPLLQAAAVPAALGWAFQPPSTPTKIRLTFEFRIQRKPDGYTSRATTVFRPPYEVEVRCRPMVPDISISAARPNNEMQLTRSARANGSRGPWQLISVLGLPGEHA